MQIRAHPKIISGTVTDRQKIQITILLPIKQATEQKKVFQNRMNGSPKKQCANSALCHVGKLFPAAKKKEINPKCVQCGVHLHHNIALHVT